MPVGIRTTTKGGDNLRKFFDEAGKGGVQSLEVGFFATAKYPDGTPVASVAAWNEFGTKRNGKTHIPERPFFRQAVAQMEKDVPKILKAGIDPEAGVVDRQLAGQIGAHAQSLVEGRIADLDTPENAPSTIKRKGEGKKPLVDTAQMSQSVTWKITG